MEQIPHFGGESIKESPNLVGQYEPREVEAIVRGRIDRFKIKGSSLDDDALLTFALLQRQDLYQYTLFRESYLRNLYIVAGHGVEENSSQFESYHERIMHDNGANTAFVSSMLAMDVFAEHMNSEGIVFGYLEPNQSAVDAMPRPNKEVYEETYGALAEDWLEAGAEYWKQIAPAWQPTVEAYREALDPSLVNPDAIEVGIGTTNMILDSVYGDSYRKLMAEIEPDFELTGDGELYLPTDWASEN